MMDEYQKGIFQTVFSAAPSVKPTGIMDHIESLKITCESDQKENEDSIKSLGIIDNFPYGDDPDLEIRNIEICSR